MADLVEDADAAQPTPDAKPKTANARSMSEDYPGQNSMASQILDRASRTAVSASLYATEGVPTNRAGGGPGWFSDTPFGSVARLGTFWTRARQGRAGPTESVSTDELGGRVWSANIPLRDEASSLVGLTSPFAETTNDTAAAAEPGCRAERSA